jgi:hypothetical protein
MDADSINEPIANMYDEHSYNHDTVTSNNSTVYTSPQSKRRALAEYMKLDPGYRCIGKKKDKLEYFSTSIIPGTSIRNATTGIREYNLNVGSSVSESQFFKVRYVGDGITAGNGPDTLFYNNPEHFERHMRCSVKSNIKKQWKANYEQAIRPSKSY